MRKEIVIVGSGGQGVQTLGRLLALVLNKKGFLSSFKANYGPEARGGNSSAQVVVREASSDWPEILNVNLLVPMSQEGYTTWLPKIDEKAVIIYDNYLVRNVSANRTEQYPIPATKLADEMGMPLSANMIMLGAVAAISELVNVQDILQVIPQKAGRAEGNLKALEAGYKLGKEQITKTGK